MGRNQMTGAVPRARPAPGRRAGALSDIVQAVARVGTPDEWAARVVGTVAGATGWSRVFIFRLEGEELRLLAAHGVSPEQEERSRTMAASGPSLSAQAVRRGEPVVVGRAKLSLDAQANLERQEIPAYAAFPLIARTRTFGSLTLMDTERRRVGATEVAFLQTVADTLAVGLESAELYGAVEMASRAKDDFLSIASHELRTPLTPLKGQIQILLRLIDRSREKSQPLDVDRLVRTLTSMDRQVTRLADLVNDLLDVSRIRTGQLALRLAETDLVELAATVLERFEAAPGQTLCLVREVDSLVGQWDAARLEQVITNLVSNSIKYGTPAALGKGEITVSVGLAQGRDGWARLSVRDRGVGFAPGQTERLFAPFQRLHANPAEQFGGLGLGLYISRDIVERHGGLIWAESPGPGEGATFHVLLPLRPHETP
ncbi:MAG TPA: GAF domain-containing sensor histidine kinase [Chloroflexota bacterium]|nr:GAF domain-containing sensor histidine kinase [Chloroflexota bacterium]